jgi:hypothetical protein
MRPSKKEEDLNATCGDGIVSLLVRLAWSQAKDLHETITIWPTRGGSIR